MVLGMVEDDDFDVRGLMEETLTPFHEILLSMHRRAGGSEIHLTRGGFGRYTRSCPNDEGGFVVYIPNVFGPSCTLGVDRILQDEHGLQIIFSEGAITSEDAFSSIVPMRSAKRVVVEGKDLGEMVRIVLEFLGKPLATNKSLPSLPYLQELRIASGGWDTQDLLGMVHSRFCDLLWDTMERTLLTISVECGAFSSVGTPLPILDLATLVKIREVNGVKSLHLVGSKSPAGMLAVTWNEETSQPVWI